MFFIFSKVLAFLLYPLCYVFAFLLMAVFAKKNRTKRKYLLIAISVLYIFSNGFLFNLFAEAWDLPPGKLEKGKVYSAVIVLGGFSGYDRNDNGWFGAAADRFIQSVLLQKTGRVQRVLVSGGNGNLNPGNFREGAWVKFKLKDMQIPDSCILIEDQSRNTLENASLTKALLQKHGLKGPYLLVTSAYHMRRSVRIFKNTGVDVIAYPCNYITGMRDVSFLDLLPDSDTLGKWNIYIKEVVGLAVNYISGRG